MGGGGWGGTSPSPNSGLALTATLRDASRIQANVWFPSLVSTLLKMLVLSIQKGIG